MTIPGMVFSLFGAIQAFSMMSLQEDMRQVARATAVRLAQGNLTRQEAPAFARKVLAPWKAQFEVELVFPGDLNGINPGQPSPSYEIGISAPVSALSGFGVLSLLNDGKIRARAFLTPHRVGS
jgi:hypothetical protein